VRALNDAPDCTATEVWRASFPALAFGRTKLPTTVTVTVPPAASPAPNQQTAFEAKDPALAADAAGPGSTKQPRPLKELDESPAPAGIEGSDEEVDAAASESADEDEKPTDAAAGEAAGDGIPKKTADVTTKNAAAAANVLLADPAGNVAGATANDGIIVEDRDATPAANAPPAAAPPLKRAMAATKAAAPAAAAGRGGVATAAERGTGQPELTRRKRRKLDVLSAHDHQLIAQARAHLASDMSEKYQEILRRAAELSPTERAALLTALASMIQQDQATSLQLLRQSISMAEHFTK